MSSLRRRSLANAGIMIGCWTGVNGRARPAAGRRVAEGKPAMAAVSVSIIGSFRQYYPQAALAVREFESLGVNVRSPVVSRIVNPGDEYARFETDPPQSSDQLIQATTLEKILSSDLVYVVAPGGYVGRTTCYELGRAHERSIPVYFSAPPQDLPIEIPPGSVLCVHDLVRQIMRPARFAMSAFPVSRSSLVAGGRDERRDQVPADRLAAAENALPDVTDGIVGVDPG
jgi:hypothetical protein